MIEEQEMGVSFLTFPNLSGFLGVKHGIFTRHTGKSTGPYQSLNVSFDVGDSDHHVIQNRKIIARCIEGNDLVFMDQVHGPRVMVITKDNKIYPSCDADASNENDHLKRSNEPMGGFDADAERELVGDALVTDVPNKFLVVQVADCQSILFYDPVRQVVANVHSGWRGSINNIIGRTLNVMADCFGCLASDIISGISPSLGPCCSEFVNYREEIPEEYWKYKDDNSHFDFWSISLDQLCQAGVLIENVSSSRICTKCEVDRFFSFRGESTTGRFATLIGLS